MMSTDPSVKKARFVPDNTDFFTTSIPAIDSGNASRLLRVIVEKAALGGLSIHRIGVSDSLFLTRCLEQRLIIAMVFTLSRAALHSDAEPVVDRQHNARLHHRGFDVTDPQ